MATINLLPWREELRAERKKEFIASLALMVLVAILILFVTDLMFDSRISFQERRNAYVRQNIAELDEEVAEIRDLRSRRTELLERMRIIQDLQGNLGLGTSLLPPWFLQTLTHQVCPCHPHPLEL